MLKSGDFVLYVGDVQQEYTGQSVEVIEFDLKHRFMMVKANDGQVFAAFYDEIEA